MRNIRDEVSLECLAIRIDRELKAAGVIDVLSDLLILRGVHTHIRSKKCSEIYRQVSTGLDLWRER
jgi:hypothetical protein